MKVVLFYRHADGRMFELREVSSSRVEIWRVYPVRELVDKAKSLEDAKALVPEGFEPDQVVFSPPCPKCNLASPMTLETGMYVCRECGSAF